MLSNAYFLAKFRFDTAENEPAKKLLNFQNIANSPTQSRTESVAAQVKGIPYVVFCGFLAGTGVVYLRLTSDSLKVGTDLSTKLLKFG